MSSIRVFVEAGKKKTFAGAVDWPGWCRSGRDEETALQALMDYGPRYAQVVQSQNSEFKVPAGVSELAVIERHEGNTTTDFGAPAIILAVDREPIERVEIERLQVNLQACWKAFDAAVQRATGKELRKGPRGGGRDAARILDHVLGAEQGYLASIAWKYKQEGGETPNEALDETRQEILKALTAAARNELPEQGPRGGTVWPVRYFIRRVAWHALDHAWEIEDRMT